MLWNGVSSVKNGLIFNFLPRLPSLWWSNNSSPGFPSAWNKLAVTYSSGQRHSDCLFGCQSQWWDDRCDELSYCRSYSW